MLSVLRFHYDVSRGAFILVPGVECLAEDSRFLF